MEADQLKSIGQYQLGDVLGKGAFGSVFRGLNMENGQVVALKQVKLTNLPKSEITSIMTEIDLLKKLHHANIVKYYGFIKTLDFLFIILEYCENGSLQTTIKKFGRVSESLVAVYIYQTLEGLVYLHDQGVIHRDIKAANLLSTKEGHVKLGDFGVATNTADGGDADNQVVGSPYWMAPEVVELAGITTASDIWSVGCTIIELLTGKPPNFDLSPMAALFKIVQDDHPPIPDGFSHALRDFLNQCFQKDPNLRINARKLMRHPWLQQARQKAAPAATSETKLAETLKTVVISDAASKSTAGTLRKHDEIVAHLEQYVEMDDSDMDDLDGLDKLQEKIRKRQAPEVDSNEEMSLTDADEDPFDDTDFVSSTLSNTAPQEQQSRAMIISENIDAIKVEASDAANLQALDVLLTNYSEDLSTSSIRRVIPIFLTLEVSQNPEIHLKIVKLINLISTTDSTILIDLCSFGAVPLVVRLASSPNASSDFIMESASFVRKLVSVNDFTRRVFLSCRGLDFIVLLLKSDYEKQRRLHWMAIEGLHTILTQQGPNNKNDFCVLVLRSGALGLMIERMRDLAYDESDEGLVYLEQVVDLLAIFSTAGSQVKDYMAARIFMIEIIDSLEYLHVKQKLTVMRVLRNLSSSPPVLETLHRMNCCGMFIELLSASDLAIDKDLRNQSIFLMFNYCRVNKSRQERAALNDIVPPLLQLIADNDPLKQFALPILCDLAHTSRTCRQILEQNDVLSLFLRLLRDGNNDYWQVNSLESIYAWMVDEPDKIEPILVQFQNIEILVNLFVQARSTFLISIATSLQKLITSAGPQLAKSMAKASFMQKLVDRLDHPNVMVKLALLKILKAILKVHGHPQLLMLTYDIESRVETIMTKDASVLVAEIASGLCVDMAEIVRKEQLQQ